MSLPKNQSEKNDGVNGLIAVAIDGEKGSQYALKWAIENLLTRSATVILIHVKILSPSLSPSPSLFTSRTGINANSNESLTINKEPDAQNIFLFLPYSVFCTRKDIQCKEVLLEDVDVSKALIEYASRAGIGHLVLGSSTKTGLLKRFQVSDIPKTISKGAPDFCTVYVIAKGKIQSMRSASHPAPNISHFQVSQTTIKSDQSDSNVMLTQSIKEQESHSFEPAPRKSQDGIYSSRSPFTRKGYNEIQYVGTFMPYRSFVSSGWRSTDHMFPSMYGNSEIGISNSVLVVRGGPYGKKNHGMNQKCWKCGKPGHVKKNCPGGEISEKGCELNASNVSLIMGEDDLL